MNRMICIGALVCFWTSFTVAGEEPWKDALGKMPLATNITELNRTNCVKTMLRAFQSNDVVKALIFMPGATDEFYMFHRARAALTNTAPTLLGAVTALTNKTLIRATFRPPLLLLHTDEDPLEPLSEINHPLTAASIRESRFVPHAIYNDRDWDYLLPIVEKTHRMNFMPRKFSIRSFHFYRHSFAAYDLNGWEALECIALAGKTKFTVERKRVVFQGDERVRAIPTMEGYVRE